MYSPYLCVSMTHFCACVQIVSEKGKLKTFIDDAIEAKAKKKARRS